MDIISELHSKFSQKSWNETFQLVRRCMDKSRDSSISCEPLRRSMERLQEVFNVSSMHGMKTRLEMIAKQHGLEFHVTDATCYLTADLFYLEVVLLPCGGVEVVKVALHGGVPVASASFLELLRSKDFVTFSSKVGDLALQYNIPGDNEIKLKLFELLQALREDLEQKSHFLLSSNVASCHTDHINNGMVGFVTSEKEGTPLTIQFYVSSDCGLKTIHPEGSTCPAPETMVYTAQLAIALSDVPYKLQMASSIAHPPQLDAQSHLLFESVEGVSSDPVPACFLLKLNPAVEMIPSLWNKLSQITDVPIPDVDLQWAPLPHLLSANSHGRILDGQDIISTVSVAEGGRHTYVFPLEAWEEPAHRGSLVDTIPFTHLSHVPVLLNVLRHQCTVNSILRSAMTFNCEIRSLPCELHFEVLPETDTSFTVTFHPPDTDSLAVLVVDILGPRQVTCKLFGAGLNDSLMEECVSSVMKRGLSLPMTLQTLYNKLTQSISNLVSTSLPAAMETNSVCAAVSISPGSRMDTNGASTTFSQSALVPDDRYATMSVSQSELLPEINSDLLVNPYPLPPVGVFLTWSSNNSQLSESF